MGIHHYIQFVFNDGFSRELGGLYRRQQLQIALEHLIDLLADQQHARHAQQRLGGGVDINDGARKTENHDTRRELIQPCVLNGLRGHSAHSA